MCLLTHVGISVLPFCGFPQTSKLEKKIFFVGGDHSSLLESMINRKDAKMHVPPNFVTQFQWLHGFP